MLKMNLVMAEEEKRTVGKETFILLEVYTS